MLSFNIESSDKFMSGDNIMIRVSYAPSNSHQKCGTLEVIKW